MSPDQEWATYERAMEQAALRRQVVRDETEARRVARHAALAERARERKEARPATRARRAS